MASSRKTMPANRQRPKFLDLTAIRLPLPGFVSILHRVSGAGLFLSLPGLLFLLGTSLESPEGFARAGAIAAHPLIKLVLFGLIWAYLHHFCAGMRFLLLDLHIGIEKQAARRSSFIVLAVSLTLTAVVAAKLWGIF